MDAQGYVPLEEISKFRRIRNLRASAQQILEAVKTSKRLDVNMESCTNIDDSHLLDSSIILAVKIRSVDDRMLWETCSDPSSPSRSNSPYLWTNPEMSPTS